MNQAQEFSGRERESNLMTQPGNLQLLLITVVVLMLFMGPTILLTEIDDAGSWRILPVLVALVAIEGAWTTRWLSKASRRINRPHYRLAEALTLITLIILSYWLSLGKLTLSNLFDQFIVAPLSIFDIHAIVLTTLCLLAWAWSNQLTGIFSKLAMSNDEIEYFTTPSAERVQRGIAPVVPIYRNQLYQDFIHHWAVGGLLLAFFAMLATFELTSSNLEAIQTFDFRIVTRLGLPSELLLALIIYFGAGFWLASHARMAVMQARWIAGGLEIDPSITRRWRRQVIVIIIVVSVLAAFLPIGSTLAISEIFQVLLGYMFAAFSILLGLIPFLIAWLLSLFSSEAPEQDSLPVEISPFSPGAENSEPILEIPPAIVDGFFIVASMVIAFMALVYFLRFRSLKFNLAWLTDAWSLLVAQIHEIWGRFSKGSTKLAKSIRIRLERATLPGRAAVNPWHYLPIRGQSPREQIRYYYLSILHRAEKKGVIRAPGQTPLEHAENLTDNWPEAANEIGDLTQMFLQARYSRQPMTDQASDKAKRVFQRLRKAVRKNVTAGSSTEEP